MTGRVIEGGCLCRAVRYRVNGLPIVTSLCHCRTCRLAAGAPSVGWVIFRSSDFMFSAAQPARFRSSPTVIRTFCGRCGTSLTYQRDTEPDTIDVTTASLDSPDDFAPTREIWIAHKLAWERLNDTLPQYPESSRPAGGVAAP
ncbi:MAG: GFA family protein [Acidobacteria bacterium]|nr:MAG: GFA family protein [Acidobacteriota bacterium]